METVDELLKEAVAMHGHLPTYVDVLEITGPIPLPNDRSSLLEAGESSMLQLTFQLAPHMGFVPAFTTDLNGEGIGP